MVITEDPAVPDPDPGTWPDSLPAVQVRIARPTDQLDTVVAWYTNVLGLPELTRAGGDGWTVVMIGLPGAANHLEFVAHESGISGAAPTAENLLVLYFRSTEEQAMVADRIRAAGGEEVPLDNPWWGDNGAVAFPDPDGWRVVLMPHPVSLGGDAA